MNQAAMDDYLAKVFLANFRYLLNEELAGLLAKMAVEHIALFHPELSHLALKGGGDDVKFDS